jgi:hypothetical protein
MASPPTVIVGICANLAFDADAKMEADHEQVFASISHSPQEEIVHDAQLSIQDGDEASHAKQSPRVDLPHASPELSPRHFPDTSLYLQLERSGLPHLPDFRADADSHFRTETTLHVPVEHDPQNHPVSRPRTRHREFRHPERSPDQEHNIADVSFQGSLPNRNMAPREHNQQQAGAVLHGIFDMNGSYRIGKALKKRQVPQQAMAPTSFRNTESGAQTEFDKALVTLGAAHHADQLRKDSHITTQAEHFKEVKTLLQDQLNQYSVTISEWKDKHAALNANVVHLREKAKTNQKYVSGLQKDHEKLQRCLVTLQDECKKVLKEKIAEVEHEKKSLLHEFNNTLDTLGKGHKNLKETVDDLYVQLRISEAKRRDLAENMTKQIAMYEQEKSQRNDLESQLLPSIQSVQRQLEDRSAHLSGNINALQNSINGVTSGLAQDTSLQECIAILRKVQKTPFLTAKDGEKSEGILRFVYDG